MPTPISRRTPLAFLRSALMLLAYAFDPIPVLAAIVRKLFGDLIQSAWRGPTHASIGVELHYLSDVEFVHLDQCFRQLPRWWCFFAAGGFAITNINSGIEAQAERQTFSLPSGKLDTLMKSRADECRRRGHECRRPQHEEQEVIVAPVDARADIKTGAAPQAAALGVTPAHLHLIQAGSMVLLYA